MAQIGYYRPQTRLCLFSNAMLSLLSNVMPKGHQTLKSWKYSNSLLHGMAILNHVSGPGQTMQTMLMRKHSSMFSCCTHMEILLLTAVVAEALIMSLHIFTS